MNIWSKRSIVRGHAVLLASLVPVVLFAVAWAPAGQAAPAAQLALTSARAAPKAYVALHDEGVLAVLDTGANAVLGYIPVPLGAHGVAMTPDGSKVYVGSDQFSTVSVIDTTTDAIVAQIEVGTSPHGLSISSDGRQLVVSVRGEDDVVIIDTTTDRITGRVSIAGPDRSAISPDGRIAYVGSTSLGDNALAIVDLTRPAQIGRVVLSRAPRALAFSPDGKRLYFTLDGSDALHVLDTGRNRVEASIPAGASPHGLVSAGTAYGELVLSQPRNELEILDPTRNTVRGTVAVGKLPRGIATSADERTAYVTNEGSGDVSVVDLVLRKVTATISIDTLGGAPGEIVVQPRVIAPLLHSKMPLPHAGT